MLRAAQQRLQALSGEVSPPPRFVDGGLVAFKVADLDHLWVELDVFERNLKVTSVELGAARWS